MALRGSSGRFKREDRPAPCRACGSAGWWNGVRHVAQVVRDVAGEIHHVADMVRSRVRCSNRSCTAQDSTIYEEGGYPHRLYQLPVLASAVAEVAFKPGSTFSQAAAGHFCSRRTVARWHAWVGELVEPGDLARACARLDPEGMPPGMTNPGGRPPGRVGVVLALLERFVDLLRHFGVGLVGGASGLSALLCYQLQRFGDIRYLTRSSPPLRIPSVPITA